jgi:hypothetical protein
MSQTTEEGALAPPWSAALAFVEDFARHAGRRGLVGALLVLASVALENVGVALLIPFLSQAMQDDPGAAAAVFSAIGAQSRFARLAMLLGVFCVLLLARAALFSARDGRLAQLQADYAEYWRGRILLFPLALSSALRRAGHRRGPRRRHDNN